MKTTLLFRRCWTVARRLYPSALALCVLAVPSMEAQVRTVTPPRTIFPRTIKRPIVVRGETIPEYRYTPDPRCVAMITRQKHALVSDTALRRQLSLDTAAKRQSRSADLEEARNCAYREDSIRRAIMVGVASEELLRAGRMHMDIPELHDEQRLAGDGVNAKGFQKLGPVAGIYTSPFLYQFTERWQIEAHGDPGVLVGFVVVTQDTTAPLPESYKAMKLAFGMNCIFLEATGATGYRAWVIQPPKNEPCRDDHGMVRKPASLQPLPVVVTPTGFSQGDMVPAARFLDDTQGRAVFGFPCLADWCQIGRPGFSPLRTNYCDWFRASSTSVPCEANAEARIPSWYDEQQIDELQGNDWVATPIRMAIVPQPSITRFQRSSFEDTLRHISNLYVRDPLPENSTLYAHGIRQGENRVELTFNATTKSWWFVIRPITNPLGIDPITGRPFHPIAFAVRPHAHFDARVPGTARFRYTIRDPGVWGPCGNECCSSDGTY